MQANYLLNSLAQAQVFGVVANNRSRLASSAYRIERGVRSIMMTSVVNILCPTNLLKYVLYMVILNDKRIFRESLLSWNYFARTVFLTLFCTLTSRATPHTLRISRATPHTLHKCAASRNLPRSARCRQLYMIRGEGLNKAFKLEVPLVALSIS